MTQDGDEKHLIVDDMKLPEGKTCADCWHFRRCVGLIGAEFINDKAIHCDWGPSRFRAVPPTETR